MTHKKKGRARARGRNWITQLDGKPLPKDLLTPIMPIANVLAFASSQPDPKLIREDEERKLDMLVGHMGWDDHFRDTHNKYRIPYLLVLEEQSGHSQDPSAFKELLLNWARENLQGFSILSVKRGPGAPKRRPAEDLKFLVDVFNSRKAGNVAERCIALAKRLKPTKDAREPRTLQNRFAKISARQLSGWLRNPSLGEPERAAVNWAMATKRQGQKKQSRKSVPL